MRILSQRWESMDMGHSAPFSFLSYSRRAAIWATGPWFGLTDSWVLIWVGAGDRISSFYLPSFWRIDIFCFFGLFLLTHINFIFLIKILFSTINYFVETNRNSLVESPWRMHFFFQIFLSGKRVLHHCLGSVITLWYALLFLNEFCNFALC